MDEVGMERPKRITNVSHINRRTIEKSKYNIGVYSGHDYPHKSCLCTIWPSHPYFILHFYTCFTIRVGVSPMELDLYMGERVW